MAEAGLDGVLRRKVAAAKAVRTEGGPGADRSWRLALARAARDELDLPLDVLGLRIQHQALAELLELPFQNTLIAVLQGPAEGMGLMLLSQDVVAALIEVQTLGKVALSPVEARKPTRTDAAMVAPLLDAALIELEHELAQEADLIWAGGFRYGSFLDDPRPLGLLMEDCSYRLLVCEVSLGLGARKGTIYMALPAKGRGMTPSSLRAPEVDTTAGNSFTQDLAAQIEQADCVLEAVLARVGLPLHRVMALKVGEVLPLGRATINRIQFQSLDGTPLVEGKLGQNRGMRAIRLALPEAMGVFSAQHRAALPLTGPAGSPAGSIDAEASDLGNFSEPGAEDFLSQFGTPMAQAG